MKDHMWGKTARQQQNTRMKIEEETTGKLSALCSFRLYFFAY